MKTSRLRSKLFAPAISLLALSLGTGALQAQQGVKQVNLVSDIPGLATHTDPNLVNPWGVSFSGGSPFWVSNAGSGTSTLYNTSGTPLPLVVTIPGVPTGQVFTGGGFASENFVFATANGTIAGWRGALGTNAETLYTSPDAVSSYLGLAYAVTGTGNYLYAANFGAGRIDVISPTGLVALSGSFSDPSLPAGYAPFNVQKLGSSLYVTYALKDAVSGEEVVGVGNGFVNKFDLAGNLQGRVASNGALNAPWGLAIAPTGFGALGGSLLVGNFGDGTVNAYDPTSGDFIANLRNSFGDPLTIDGLWALTFGNGGNGGKLDTLYFTAGIEDETHGLFGSLTPVPEPAVTGSVAGVGLMSFCMVTYLRKKRAKLKVATA